MFQKSLLTLLLVSSSALFAQDTLQKNDTVKKSDKWDVSDPYKDSWKINEVPLNTDEGTWMNLDVSPDGKTVVFDLLGDIYKMPVSGGKAIALRSGMPYEVQPRFSPDGSRISFTRVSPTPCPSRLVLKKGLNNSSAFSFEMPFPESVILTCFG